MAGYRSRNNDVREEGEKEASEEKMEERVDDDVVRSRQINTDSQEGREAVCVCVCVCVCVRARECVTS